MPETGALLVLAALLQLDRHPQSLAIDENIDYHQSTDQSQHEYWLALVIFFSDCRCAFSTAEK